MTKSKLLIHNQMLSFLKGHCNSVRIVDSTNGNAGARLLYVQESQPDLLIFVVLSPSSNGDDDDGIVEKLLLRTRNRLEGGKCSHPSFPFTIQEQRKKHESILKGIEYPLVSELESIGGKETRKVLLHCDPFDELKLSSLPFKIFLEYSASYTLSQLLNKEKTTRTSIG